MGDGVMHEWQPRDCGDSCIVCGCGKSAHRRGKRLWFRWDTDRPGPFFGWYVVHSPGGQTIERGWSVGPLLVKWGFPCPGKPRVIAGNRA